MHTAKRPAIRRLFLIDRELRAGTFPTLERLARLNDVNSKTIYRDLEYLRDQYGAPLEYCRKHRGWRYCVPTYHLPAIIITQGELLAFFLAEQVLRQHPGLHFEQDLRTAIGKLTELLPEQVSVDWKEIRRAHSFRNSVTAFEDADLLSRLCDAILRRRQLTISYWTASREAETTRTIDPWHLACVDGAWYVIAWCHLRRAIRIFSPSRMRTLTETGENFTVTPDFDPQRIFRDSFKVVCEDGQPLQAVRLRFAPSAAKYVRECLWHPSQVICPEADGGLVLELKLRSLIEVRRWILSWGSECKVLSPPKLLESIRHEAERMLEHADLNSKDDEQSAARRRPKTRRRLPQKG